MTNLSVQLDEAVRSDFVRHGGGAYVMAEGTADDWMGTAIRQVQSVAAAHAAYLKKETGRGWKLFKHPLTENGRLIFRFDLNRRQDMTKDPMVVLRMAYSSSADHYLLQVEVWKSVGEQIGSAEIDDVDTAMLEDPERIYYRVEKALRQLRARTESVELNERVGLDALPMKRSEFISWDSPIRHKDTGKVMVPTAEDLANDLAYSLAANRWTKGFRTRAHYGSVVIYDTEPTDVVAVVGLVGGRVNFESWPQEDDHKVNEAVQAALEAAMKRFRPWGPSTKGEDMSIASNLEAALTEDGADIERFKRKADFSKRMGSIENKKRGPKIEPEKPKSGGIGGAIKKGMKMVFGKWAKTEADELGDEGVYPLDDSFIGTDRVMDEETGAEGRAKAQAYAAGEFRVRSGDEERKIKGAKAARDAAKEWNKKTGKTVTVVDEGGALLTSFAAKPKSEGWEGLDEARLGFGVDMSGPGAERTNPTKSGPAAERANTLKSARAGIERMLQAVEVVRGWVKTLGLGDKDKTGAAAAALKAASSEIAKVESVQDVLATMFELPSLDPGAGTVLDEAIRLIEKRGAEQSAEAVKAKDGLARMVDGLRQLLGMLRQAKLTGRILDQVEAAINGLKATRDAIDALAEASCGVATSPGSDLYPPGDLYSKFERTPASKLRKGDWVQGGGSGMDMVYRKVMKIERQEDDMQYVILHFSLPYRGADGIERTVARLHKDALIKAAR